MLRNEALRCASSDSIVALESGWSRAQVMKNRIKHSLSGVATYAFAACLVTAYGTGCSLVIDGDRFRVQAMRDAGSDTSDGGPARDAGSDDTDGGSIDGGDRDAGARDAGPPRDAGPGPDGGPRDAGFDRDAGFLRDAGPPRDAGPGPDGGPRDAGPERDAGFLRDAGPPRDGGIPRDAGPDRDGGVVDSGSPDGGVPEIAQVLIGPGALEDGARGVPIWILGNLLPPSGAVVVSDPQITVTASRVNAMGTIAAAVLDVAVDTSLAEGGMRPVAITVSDGANQATRNVMLVGRAELDVTGNETLTAPNARYSRIDVANGAVLTLGTAGPARLVSNGPVTIAGTIRARGATNQTPGPGGCAGGGVRGEGACSPSGGGPGRAGITPLINATGGGGGGNRTAGQSGGANIGDGGAINPAGNAFVVPLDAHGGGGGGGAQGSTGAGGGGVLEIRALSHFAFSGTLDARGGNGAAFQPGLGCILGSAAAGGGAGGAIVVHARTAALGAGMIDVRGGNAGDGMGCPDGEGGAGGHGYVRLDVPDISDLSSVMVSPNAFTTAPMWAEATQVLVSPQVVLHFDVVGAPGLPFEYSVDRGLRSSETMPGSGPADVTVSLTPGLHELCLFVGPSTGAGTEAENCRYLVAL